VVTSSAGTAVCSDPLRSPTGHAHLVLTIGGGQASRWDGISGRRSLLHSWSKFPAGQVCHRSQV